MGPGPRDLGPRDPGTPPESLKEGPQDSLQNLKVEPPHLSLMNSFFSEYFIVFYLCFFFKKDVYKKISTVS